MDITLDCLITARNELKQTTRGEKVPILPSSTLRLTGYFMYHRRTQPNPIVEGVRRTIRYLRTGKYNQSYIKNLQKT